MHFDTKFPTKSTMSGAYNYSQIVWISQWKSFNYYYRPTRTAMHVQCNLAFFWHTSHCPPFFTYNFFTLYSIPLLNPITHFSCVENPSKLNKCIWWSIQIIIFYSHAWLALYEFIFYIGKNWNHHSNDYSIFFVVQYIISI